MIYLRQGVTFQVLGLIFQVSESKANDIFNYWQDIFRNALPSNLLEQIQKNGESEEELSNLLNEYELIVDSAEQAIPRPGDYDEQKKFYSSAGKKKYHTWLRPQRSAIAKINLLCCLVA